MTSKRYSVKKTLLATSVVGVMALAGISGCTSMTAPATSESTNTQSERQGEHQREGGGEGAGEESGTTYTLDESYDVVRKGSRLIMAYDAASNAFVGTVENTTTDILPNVRVEVHLSNGTELGPTTPVDLAPGETIDVMLEAAAQAFDGWTPHAEVGNSEHVSEGESGGEHGSSGESGGEHGNGSESGGESSGEHGSGG